MAGGAETAVPTQGAEEAADFPVMSEQEQVHLLGTDQETEPPDTQLAAGPTDLVEMDNSAGSIWSKAGALIKVVDLNTFFPVPVSSGYTFGDPRILYDPLSQRWFASGLAFNIGNGSQVYAAASQTSDPTGNWDVYTVSSNASGVIDDQPMIGVSSDKVVVSWNDYSGSTFDGEETWVLEKSEMLSGSSLAWSRFGPDTSRFRIVPAQSLTSTTTEWLTYNDAACSAGIPSTCNTGSPVLGLVAITGTPANSDVAWTEYDPAIAESHAPLDPLQPGGTTNDQKIDGRLLSAVWQNGLLWTSGTDACTPAGDTVVRDCLRLVQVSTTGSTPSILQDFDAGATGAYVYYPAVTMDGSGNLFVSYSESSTSMYPSAFAVDQTAGASSLDPSVLVYGGSADYSCSLARVQRWGDYSAAAPDPTLSADIWIAAEYAPSSSDCAWGTVAAEVTLQTVTPSITSVSPRSGPMSGGQSVTISGTGFEPGATVTFGSNPASSVTFSDSFQLTAVTPSGIGTVGVTVANPDGTSAADASAYTYLPTITAVNPLGGPTSGGQSVTITGGGFLSGATVMFGAAQATDVTVTGNAQITAVTPPGNGAVSITVTNPGGGSTTDPSAYTYAQFAPQNVGAAVAVLTPDGGQKLIFWEGPSDHHLYEAWYGVSTQRWSGPVDLSSMLGIASNSGADLASPPTVTFTPDGGQQLVFWQGADGDLWEAWYSYELSNWQVQDLSSARALAGAGRVGSAPTVTFTPGGGQQLVFWEGTDHDLWEAWYSVEYNVWQSQDLSTGLLRGAGAGTVASAPSVILTPGGGQQLVFWQGTNGHIWEAWYSVASSTWESQDLSAVHLPSAADIASEPDVILTPGGGQQLVFYQAAGTGDLWEAWYSVASSTWRSQDLSVADFNGLGQVASEPVLTVTPDGGQQLVFWQTASGGMDEAWYSVTYSTWASQNLSATTGLSSAVASRPSLIVFGNGNQDLFWQGSSRSLWELYFSGTWTYYNWTAGG